MRTWDAITGKPGGKFKHDELVGFAQWDASGKVVAAGANVINDDRRTVAVFDAATGRKLLTVTDPERKKGFGFLGFGLSADGRGWRCRSRRRAWSTTSCGTCRRRRRLWAAPMPDDWPPGGVVFTADGRVLVGATDIITLDAATGKQLDRRDLVKDEVLPVDKSNNTHLYPSRDGRTLGFVIQRRGDLPGRLEVVEAPAKDRHAEGGPLAADVQPGRKPIRHEQRVDRQRRAGVGDGDGQAVGPSRRVAVAGGGDRVQPRRPSACQWRNRRHGAVWDLSGLSGSRRLGSRFPHRTS